MMNIFFLAATAYLSGYPLYRIFFRSANAFEKILIPQILSLIATPLFFAVLYLLFGFDAAAYMLIPLVLIFAVLSTRIRQEKKGMPKLLKNRIAIVSAIFLVSVFVAINMSARFFTELEDPAFHLSVINQISEKKILPPDSPCLSGNAFFYPWFYHLTISLMSIYTGFSAADIIYYFGIYLALLFVASALFLAGSYFRNENAAVFFMLIISFYFSTSFLILPMQQSYALVIIFLFIHSIFALEKEGSYKNAFFAGLLGAMLIYIHGLTFIFSLLIVFSYIVSNMVKQNRQSLKTIFFLILPFIFSIPYYLFVSSQASRMLLLEPLASLQLFLNPVFVLLLLPVPFIFKNMARNSENGGKNLLAISMAVTLFVFTNIFVMVKSPNIDRFAGFMAIPILFLVLDNIKIEKLPGFAYVLLIAALLFYPVATASYLAYSSKDFHISEEYKISEWINSNTGKNAVILSAPTSFYTGFGQRKPVICTADFLQAWLYDKNLIESRFSDMVLMFSYPSKDNYLKYNVSYIIIGKRESMFFDKYDIIPFNFSNSSAFEPVYQLGSYKIFMLKDAGGLPENVPDGIRNTLNFTSYSRWFEV